VLIYIAFFAGLVAATVLAAVYLADRYEPEPLELVQDTFLLGALAQAGAILAVAAFTHRIGWDGWWIGGTLLGLVLVMPGHLRRIGEADERFDGIVYTVSAAAGALCVIHVANLPTIATQSPYRTALAATATPDLRDLLIITGAPGFAHELGRGALIIALAVIAGGVMGHAHMRGARPWAASLVALGITVPVVAADVLSHGHGVLRSAVVLAAIAGAVALKRRSVFRPEPHATEADVLKRAFKTLLIVFGTCLMVSVLFSALVRPASSVPPAPAPRAIQDPAS
jgi:hypothetical protein